MDRVDFFNPFDSRPVEHEDRLTWALLIALKYDPHLQHFLYDLVESQVGRNANARTWESARISTQTKWIRSGSIPLVSVLLTDVPIDREIVVEWSDREPRYDGIIEYPDRMTLIIENKLKHGNVWQEQLSPSRGSFSGEIETDTLHGTAVCLEWSNVLEGVLKYANSPIASFASREIARDLLSHVERTHPKLTPYRTFSLCGDRLDSLRRRIILLLAEISHEYNVKTDKDQLYRPDSIAEIVRMRVSRNDSGLLRLRVAMWPASTAKQADRFQMKVDSSKFLSLCKQDWYVKPNLNFSYRGKKLVWATTTWDCGSYLRFFFSGTRHYGRKYRADFSALIDEWERERLISTGDRKQLDSKFLGTRREMLDVNPEFEVYREWDLDQVIRLENQGKLESHLASAIAVPLSTWGETL